MNEATKVKIIGGLVVVGTALAGYLADLAAQGQFGVWSAVVGALAGAALTYLASKKAMTMLALFVAFVLSATACQAACRHLAPMPRYGEKINRVMLCPTFCPPLVVEYGGKDLPAENSAHLLGWRGDVATLRFDHRRGVWHIEGVLRGPSDDISIPVGMRVR